MGTRDLIVAGDTNSWSHWWGSVSENDRGRAYSSFLSSMGFEVMNTGTTPTFQTYRNGKEYASHVDVTACSQTLLGKIEHWRVDKELTTSDHNAICFRLRVGGKLVKLPLITTRKYNTRKANWVAFKSRLKDQLAAVFINSEYISGLHSVDQLEHVVNAYVSAIGEACEGTIPRVCSRKTPVNPPWWNLDLSAQKKTVARMKRRIRNAAPSRRQFVIEQYTEERLKYEKLAEEAQTTHWKEFCSTQDRESMWDRVYRVIRKTQGRQDDMLLRNTSGRTLTPDESAELLLRTFYPDDTQDTDTPHHATIRREVEEMGALPTKDDPPFTEAELTSVLRSQNPKKAPGHDGLTSDICSAAISSDGGVFMSIANKCLDLKHFPRQWKVAHVIVLRKPAKEDYTHPKSYRPIGLLPVLGKTLEKMMVARIKWHVLPSLSNKQYGFMPQKGTEDALYDVLEHIRREISQQKIVLMISLDIEGAFDNAWWPALLKRLAELRCPNNIYSLVTSYLVNRRVVVNYARRSCEKGTSKGCVQGSIGGPIFWNILIDSLLQLLEQQQVHCQAFADDVVLVFSGSSSKILESQANKTLEMVVNWGNQNKLNFAAHKTQAMIFTKKLKYECPRLTMSGKPLGYVRSLKLLGLIIDDNLTFKEHVAATCKKVADIYKQLACCAKVSWGLNPEITRTIYTAVIEPIVLYAAGSWASAARLEMNSKPLCSLQRAFAIKICRGYRTISQTSALVLAGLLPLDLRIQETAALYEAKKRGSLDYIPPGRALEGNVSFLDQTHPAHSQTISYTLLESTLGNMEGPMIYTDGSKIEGRVGAALSRWSGGEETHHEIFSLHPACTVFQAELYALHRAVQLARFSDESTINILSDSRSSLDLLTNPSVQHPLAKGILENIRKIRETGKSARLFWLRAHVGTAGNERADELAKVAARSDLPYSYDRVPLSYVKRNIRKESVHRWQDRYDSSTAGVVTRTILPDVEKTYRLVRREALTSTHVQFLTGHGGLAEYLHRFGLKASPACECDPTEVESVWHVVESCPRFQVARMDVEFALNRQVVRQELPSIMYDAVARPVFLDYVSKIFRVAAARNGSTLHGDKRGQRVLISGAVTSSDVVAGMDRSTGKQSMQVTMRSLVASAEPGVPGLRIGLVPLFMENTVERLGIAFCNVSDRGRVAVSPGLAALLNGSTKKSTIKRTLFRDLPSREVGGIKFKLIRHRSRTVLIFVRTVESPYSQANEFLKLLGRTGDQIRSCTLSVDAMAVEYDKGSTIHLMGCLDASKHHNIIVYGNRGVDMSFLLPYKHSLSSGHEDNVNSPPALAGSESSGAERMQESLNRERTSRSPSSAGVRDGGVVRTLFDALVRATQSVPKAVKGALRRPADPALNTWTQVKTPDKRGISSNRKRTKADMGQVTAPTMLLGGSELDQWENAYREFLGLTRGNLQVHSAKCRKILETFRRGNESLLKVLLDEADAAIYDNSTGVTLRGVLQGSYMAAYHWTGGFVLARETQQAGPGLQFSITGDDSVVVVAKCTKIMLDDGIIRMADSIRLEDRVVPTVNWVEGVPGCGKSTWVVEHFDEKSDLIVTATTEAAEDLKKRLTQRLGIGVRRKVRTLASVLVNGSKANYQRLIIDEAYMNHFGSLVMACKLTGVRKVVLLGDVNQLPYIDRENLFQLSYHRMARDSSKTVELKCTYRNPLDVAFALSGVYEGIYSARMEARSLSVTSYTGTHIPPDAHNTLYLVHKQVDKQALLTQGYGSGNESKVLTIHEAQGQTSDRVAIIRGPGDRCALHDSIQHAVVAISRHTKECIYYTDDGDDATARLIHKAARASTVDIVEYNVRMALHHRDDNAISKLLNYIKNLPYDPFWL